MHVEHSGYHRGAKSIDIKKFYNLLDLLRETLFKSEDEIGAETLALHFIATEIGHKNVQILLKLAETLA